MFGVGHRKSIDRCGDACNFKTIDSFEHQGIGKKSHGVDHTLRTNTTVLDGKVCGWVLMSPPQLLPPSLFLKHHPPLPSSPG